MKLLFYWTLRGICRIAAHLYFRGIEINGKENIPKTGSLIFAPNHQNAFLDAILIGIFSPKPVAYFTRGDIFKKPFLWFLDALNMLPVYRAVDGFSMAAQNEKTFDLAVSTLINNKPLMIFPEANHDYPYVLRTLSKGTARIAFATQEKTEELVYIIPVGLNYFRRHSPRFKLIMNYGKPINIKDYEDIYKEHKGKALTQVRNKMTEILKSEMVIPDLDDQYEQKAKVFTLQNEKLDFLELKSVAASLKFEKMNLHTFLKPLVLFLSIPNFIPLLLSKYVVSRFEDPVFEGSMKFGLAALVFPIWYLIVFLIVGILSNYNIAVVVVTLLILLLFLRQEVKRHYTVTEHQYQTKW